MHGALKRRYDRVYIILLYVNVALLLQPGGVVHVLNSFGRQSPGMALVKQLVVVALSDQLVIFICEFNELQQIFL